MRRLLVMRHGKSDWSVGAADHERPLNERGRGAADAMGRLLADMGEAPDHVITSSAVRARTTAERAAASGNWNAEVEVTRDLYMTDPFGALEAVVGAPAVERLMVVGHEPTWSGLVAHLTGARAAIKTATVAVIDVHVADWTNALEAGGELYALLQPRDFTP